jgi:drug/metabolite transporter (DMT)-like permease
VAQTWLWIRPADPQPLLHRLTARLFSCVLNHPWVIDTGLPYVAAVWGTTYWVTQSVVAVMPVFWFLFARFALTTVVLVPFVRKRLRRASALPWRTGGLLGLNIRQRFP